MITIYTITYNEELMLPYFIVHYRGLFPECRIVVYDNQSTDKTPVIAKAAGCEVVTYDTGGKLDDKTYLKIKNNCWKDAKTKWVLVADCDEFCFITPENLQQEERQGTSHLLFEAYNMVNQQNNTDIYGINQGIRSQSYDKLYCFNKERISEINYSPGAHGASPTGKLQSSNSKYKAFHYKYINPDYMVERHRAFAKRLSAENLKYGYGGHYLYTEEQIRKEFEEARKSAKTITL